MSVIDALEGLSALWQVLFLTLPGIIWYVCILFSGCQLNNVIETTTLYERL